MGKVRGHFKGQQNMTGLEAIEHTAENLRKVNAEMAAGRSEYRKNVSGYPDPLVDAELKDQSKMQGHAKDMTSFLVGLGRVIQGDV